MDRGVGRFALLRYGDLGLAITLAALGECELFFRALRADWPGPRALNTAVVVVIALSVLWRRRAPLAALVAYAVPASVWLASVYGPSSNLPIEPLLVLLILVYSAASYAPLSQGRLVAGAVGLLFASEVVLLVAGRKSVGNAVPGLALIGLSYLVGRALRGKHLFAESMQRRASEIQAGSAKQAAMAVAAERDRIARELHDVIAHSVSLIVVQAGAGERLLETAPEQARESFDAIRRAGADALDELRRLLGLLRDRPAGGMATEPQPGLDRLERLVAEAREAGLEVKLEIHGKPRVLPPGIDLAAYRIVQEALTNVRKHSGTRLATATVEYGARELLLTVADDAPTRRRTTATTNGPGHGLIGMRERVAIYGGTLEAGPREPQGFEVRARLPIEQGTT